MGNFKDLLSSSQPMEGQSYFIGWTKWNYSGEMVPRPIPDIYLLSSHLGEREGDFIDIPWFPHVRPNELRKTARFLMNTCDTRFAGIIRDVRDDIDHLACIYIQEMAGKRCRIELAQDDDGNENFVQHILRYASKNGLVALDLQFELVLDGQPLSKTKVGKLYEDQLEEELKPLHRPFWKKLTEDEKKRKKELEKKLGEWKHSEWPQKNRAELLPEEFV